MKLTAYLCLIGAASCQESFGDVIGTASMLPQGKPFIKVTGHHRNMRKAYRAQNQMNRYWMTESRTPEAQACVKALNENIMKSYEQVVAYSSSVVTPAVKNIGRMASWASPSGTCLPTDIIACIDASKTLPTNIVRDLTTYTPLNTCLDNAGCVTNWSKMTPTEQDAAMESFRTSWGNMGKAVNSIGNKSKHNAQSAWDGIGPNIDVIGKRWAAKNAQILKNYGCIGECVDNCATRWMTMDQCIALSGNVCNCPAVFTVSGRRL